MNDLDLIERFRADLPPADPSALARARARMFRAATPPHRRRWAWGLVPAGALAAAVVVAAFAVRADEPPVTAPDDAGRVLRLAATEARRDPVLTARPDQFVYVQSVVAWAGGSADEGGMAYIPPVEKDRRIWLSVDGSRVGLLREKVAKPGTPVPRGQSVLADMPLDAGGIGAYMRDLPTDAKGMRAWLYNGADDGKDRSKDTVAFTKVGDTLREQYVPPAAVAALYEAAATIPGNTVTKQVDLAGRHGIAVSRTDHGVRFDLIFDASTYKFLGERELVVGDSPPFPKGAVIGWTAQLRIAIVDRAGQLP